MIAKARLDALTDGVFAVAMTLLVIDLKLPEAAHPQTPSQLLDLLTALDRQMFAYVLSFVVLGLRWLSLARKVDPGEMVPVQYAGWTLIHLFFITCIPFSTMIVGRHGNLYPAVWLYAGNILAAAVAALRLNWTVGSQTASAERAWSVDLVVLVAVSVAIIGLSPYLQAKALWLYALTAIPPILRLQQRMLD